MKNVVSKIQSLWFAIALIAPMFAFAQNTFRMEAGVSCPNGNCGMGMMKLGEPTGAVSFQAINIFDKDDRVVEPTASKPNEIYSPVGFITNRNRILDGTFSYTDAGVQGTAFLVSPCYIMTNYHVLYGRDEKAATSGKQYPVTFTIGQGAATLSSRAIPVASGEYNLSPGRGDWAILKLDTCLGERENVGWMETKSLRTESLISQDLMLVGHFGDKDFRIPYADPYCKIHNEDHEGVKHDCASRPGASGSPIFGVRRDGTPVVVAINCGPRGEMEDGKSYDYKNNIGANYGVSMLEVLYGGGIKDMLDDDKKRLPSGNPNRVKRPLIKKPSIGT